MNQQVIKNVVQNWKSFFASLAEYKKHPDKYKARPNIPTYLPKGSLKETILSNQICKMVDGKYLRFPKTKLKLYNGKLSKMAGKYQQVRVVPHYDYFTLEVVFLIGEKKEIQAKEERCMSIDLGMENIATLVFNVDIAPILIKGGKIKAINQWYNKLRSYYYTVLRNEKKTIRRTISFQKINEIGQ